MRARYGFVRTLNVGFVVRRGLGGSEMRRMRYLRNERKPGWTAGLFLYRGMGWFRERGNDAGLDSFRSRVGLAVFIGVVVGAGDSS